MAAAGEYGLRPYARLLTMLGEQLIKNDRIALAELIKNAYDADASKVTIYLDDFNADLSPNPRSSITIVDNGDGMAQDVVINHWLNPATDIKAGAKSHGHSRTSAGRLMQGEKGIGRFAMFKLGSVITLATRAKCGPTLQASLDIRFLDDPPYTDNAGSLAKGDEDTRPHLAAPRYLDEVQARIREIDPAEAPQLDGESGTALRISSLRSSWSLNSLRQLRQDIARMRPLTALLTGQAADANNRFEVEVIVNGRSLEGDEDSEQVLSAVQDRAVLRVVGQFEAARNSFNLIINDESRTVSLQSPDILGLALYKRIVSLEGLPRVFKCGSFEFEFLVFDMRGTAETQYYLNSAQKNVVRDHRIYLYRDGVRVLPYGDLDDDWLRLDAIRGNVGANRVLSNDQTIGLVYISQDENPSLRDKTNREGLIESGEPYHDFLHVLQLLIAYLRARDYARYLAASERRQDARKIASISGAETVFSKLQALVDGNTRASEALAELQTIYSVERAVAKERIERTEDLAGVGLSVETASHDVMATANQAFGNATALAQEVAAELGSGHAIMRRASSLINSLDFIVSRLQDVQGLFVSSRGRSQKLSGLQYVKKVQSIYNQTLSKANIVVAFDGDDLVSFQCHPATLLQVFLNLFDNSVHWLNAAQVSSPQILVVADALSQTVTFTDNGPGIDVLDVPYIFDPFFSARGDIGRGLGLYIAQQVAARDRLALTLVKPEGGDMGRIPATFQLRSLGE